MAVVRSLVSSVSLLALILAPACDSESEPAPKSEVQALGEIGSLYLDYVELLNGVDRYFCGCSVANGQYADMQECVARNGGPVVPPVLANCYAQVYDSMPEVRSYIECQTSEYMQFLDCLESAGCGGDLAGCQALVGDDDCPKLPYAANAAIAETCLGYEMPAPFVCADGTEIVPWFECNYWPDCADGSDEHADCPEGYQCQSGATVPIAWKCDGSKDCPDGDDEAECG